MMICNDCAASFDENKYNDQCPFCGKIQRISWVPEEDDNDKPVTGYSRDTIICKNCTAMFHRSAKCCPGCQHPVVEYEEEVVICPQCNQLIRIYNRDDFNKNGVTCFRCNFKIKPDEPEEKLAERMLINPSLGWPRDDFKEASEALTSLNTPCDSKLECIECGKLMPEDCKKCPRCETLVSDDEDSVEEYDLELNWDKEKMDNAEVRIGGLNFENDQPKETGEREADSMVGKDLGPKQISGKARFDRIPPRVMFEFAKIYNIGSGIKYPDKSWEKGIVWGEVYGQIYRHAASWWGGESYDPEDELHHLAHIMWACATLMHYEWEKKGVDDRTMFIPEDYQKTFSKEDYMALQEKRYDLAQKKLSKTITVEAHARGEVIKGDSVKKELYLPCANCLKPHLKEDSIKIKKNDRLYFYCPKCVGESYQNYIDESERGPMSDPVKQPCDIVTTCDACGSPNVIGEYYSEEKDHTTFLCAMCAKHADKNGYEKVHHDLVERDEQ